MNLGFVHTELVKQDSYFQLQRVTTRAGERYLVKVGLHPRSRAEQQALEREFSTLSQLCSDVTLHPTGMVTLGERPGICYRDFAGTPLETAHGGHLDVAAFVRRAKALCSVLEHFHARGHVLLGFNRSSFLQHVESELIVLADAAFARIIERPRFSEREWIESSYLTHVAPEVVGRSTQPCDVRADLYALGILLYESLSGKLPFTSSDPFELMFCHVAKRPPTLTESGAAVPAWLDSLVMRLLAKSPDERFESASQLCSALELASGDDSIRKGGRHASADQQLTFADSAWGRASVLRELEARIAAPRRRQEALLIEGAAGIGKSSFLDEVRKFSAPAHQCYGKFNQTGPARPLHAWSAALKELADVHLTRSRAELEVWRKSVLETLGELAPLIAVLVPEWGSVLKVRPRTSPDQLDTSLSRLAMAIHRLLGCHAKSDAPVVLQLDDLQWADASSMRILELLLATPDPINVVVLLSVRSADEPNGDGWDASALERTLRDSGVNFDVLRLAPWSPAELAGFLEATLTCSAFEATELAAQLYPKTGGNPFFVRELLKLLAQRHALVRDVSNKRWFWTPEAAALLPLTDNVVTFLTQNFERLPPSQKLVLGVGACLGAKFTLARFVTGSELDASVAGVELEQAVNDGFLTPCQGDNTGDVSRDDALRFAFTHDRILETSRRLLSVDERSRVCLRVARAQLGALSTTPEGEPTYDLASYYNAAEGLVQDIAERKAAARANLTAAQMAKARGAFSQGLEFARFGLQFLQRGAVDTPLDAWLSEPELSLTMHEIAAELALLNGELRLMHQLCDVILRHTSAPLQRVLTFDIRICGLKAEKKFALAVDAALVILAELGVRFPKRPSRLYGIWRFFLTRHHVLSKPIETLARLPVMAEPRVKAVARIIQSVYPAAYLGRQDLFPLLVYQHVNDSLRHGNEDYSAATYSALAIVFAGLGDLDNATRLGELGLWLLDEFKAHHLQARVYMAYYQFVFPWRNHLREAEPYYQEGIRAGLEGGDFEYACYLMASQSLGALYRGVNLADCAEDFERSRALIHSLGQERSILLQDLLCQTVHDLTRATPTAPILSGPLYHQASELPRCFEPLDENLVFHNHMLRLVVACFLGRAAEAASALPLARRHLEAGAFGNYIGAVYTFFESLVLLSDESWSASTARGRVVTNLRRLERWSQTGPMNFLHRYHLISAGLAARLGKNDAAMSSFERAHALAKANGYHHEAALARELAAQFYFRRGMSDIGQHYLREAYALYTSWGAIAVAHRLEREAESRYSFTLAIDEPRISSRPPQLGFAESLDYRALLKSSQAISSEVLLPRLVERLLRAMLEHAGAQRGLLIIERKGNLYIEAEADADRANVEFPEAEDVEKSARSPLTVLQYVARTERPLVLHDAGQDGLFAHDEYMNLRKPRSILCTPVSYQGKLLGMVYLENTRVAHVFTESRLEMIALLAGQAAISIANARFHALQLEAVQARINPHFLFNALSSIADLTTEDGRRAETAIVRLSRLYQHILTSGASELVSLEQELEVVHHYLELEKLRFGNQLVFSIDKQGEPSLVQLPGLLIQPLVENCIRHAIAPRPGVGHVNVHVSVSKRCLIVVQDDGDGTARATHGTGFGLRSVQQRLNLVYGDNFSVAITRSPGYRVAIDIPLMPSANARDGA